MVLSTIPGKKYHSLFKSFLCVSAASNEARGSVASGREIMFGICGKGYDEFSTF
jgi:hypothetical protein